MSTSRQSHAGGLFVWQRREAARLDEIDVDLEALRSMSPMVRAYRPRVVLGVPGDDVHVVANRMAHRLLTALGFAVNNLGVMVTETELVDAVSDGVDAVILSSINGHALGNCGEVPALLSRLGIDVPVYIGGNLAVGVQSWPLVQRRFLDLGFQRVFTSGESLPCGLATITAELLERLAMGGAEQGQLLGRRPNPAADRCPA